MGTEKRINLVFSINSMYRTRYGWTQRRKVFQEKTMKKSKPTKQIASMCTFQNFQVQSIVTIFLSEFVDCIGGLCAQWFQTPKIRQK